MTRLKKLFPLSFAFCDKPVRLFLGILLYYVFGTVASFVLSGIFSLLLAPLLLFAIPWIGWILLLVLCVPVIIYVILLYCALIYASAILSVYINAGIVISFIAYAKYEDAVEEIPEAENAPAEV